MEINKIDKNFLSQDLSGEEEIIWKNVLEEPFSLEGLAWRKENQNPFYRTPERMGERLPEGMRELSHHTAGCCVRFRSDSPVIRLKAELEYSCDMNHMPRCGSAGFDSYSRIEGEKGTFVFNTAMPPAPGLKLLEGVCGQNSEGEKREWILNLPLYGGVKSLMLGFEKGSGLFPPLPHKVEKPILFYGSSITQGACASRPGNAYSSFLCRKVDAPQINLGFSGSARGELFMAEMISELDLDCFVFDYDYNAVSPEELESTHEKFFRYIRNCHKELPVIFLSRCSKGRQSHEERLHRNEIIKRTYENALASGDKNVYFIEGRTLFEGEEPDACTIDGCHPTDLGFFRMYQKILPILKKALKKEEE